MTKRSIQERLRQLEARKQMLVARLNKEQRAQDTRRKILIGRSCSIGSSGNQSGI